MHKGSLKPHSLHFWLSSLIFKLISALDKFDDEEISLDNNNFVTRTWATPEHTRQCTYAGLMSG